MACIFCTRLERVLDFSQIKRADHISIPGRYSIKNLNGIQKKLYQHHAIVYDIRQLSTENAFLTVFEASTGTFDNDIAFQKNKISISLKSSDIFIVKYTQETFPPDTIIDNAKKEIRKKQKYHVLLNNCEHFCNRCCIGVNESLQTRNLWKIVLFTLLLICRTLFLSIQDGLLSTLCLHTLFWFYRQIWRKCLGEHGRVWAICWRQQTLVLWTFVSICFTEGILFNTNRYIFILTETFGCVVVSLVYIYSDYPLSNILHALKDEWLQVSCEKEVAVGDIISFHAKRCWQGWLQNMFPHRCIVTAVPTTKQWKTGHINVKIIHYTFKGILEESRYIDLTKVRLIKHSKHLESYTVEETITRSRKRLGEVLFNPFTNTSAQLCHWAKYRNQDNDIQMLSEDKTKTKKNTMFYDKLLYMNLIVDTVLEYIGEEIPESKTVYETPEYTMKATEVVRTSRIHITDDIRNKYQIITYDMKPSIWDLFPKGKKQIVVDLQSDRLVPSKITLQVLTFDMNRTLTTENKTIDLRFNILWLYHLNPHFLATANEVEMRRRLLGRCSTPVCLFDSASNLAEFIFLHNDCSIIKNFSKIKVGDILSIPGLLSDVAIIKVTYRKREVKIGFIHIVKHIFKYKFEQECVTLDPKLHMVLRKRFSGYETYDAQQVLQRANDLLGKTTFFYRTASDMLHCCKVNKEPRKALYMRGKSIVKCYFVSNSISIKGKFRVRKARNFSDLKLGKAIAFRSGWLSFFIRKYGIITDVDTEQKNVSLIYMYAIGWWNSRLKEDTICLTPLDNAVKLYDADPSLLHPMETIAENAQRMLQEAGHIKRGRNEFLQKCMFKNAQFK